AVAAHELRDVQQPALPVGRQAVDPQQHRAVAARVQHVDGPAADLDGPLHRRPVDLAPGGVVGVRVCLVGALPPHHVAEGDGQLLAHRRHALRRYYPPIGVRIAIDIDSTLHHYWDQLSAAARRRFGVDLPYEDQVTWDITRLRPEQVKACVRETHGEKMVLAAKPYPGAVEAVRAWHEAGHFIHITSHREAASQEATARWLDDIGLPYDELYRSEDK